MNVVRDESSKRLPRAGGLRPLFFVAGWMFVGLGVLGALLPLLPTTPFLLLASGCFARSSPRFKQWLERSSLLGPYLRDWNEHQGVRRSVKGLALGMLSVVVIGCLWARPLADWLTIAVLIIVAVGGIIVWRLPTIQDKQ